MMSSGRSMMGCVGVSCMTTTPSIISRVAGGEGARMMMFQQRASFSLLGRRWSKPLRKPVTPGKISPLLSVPSHIPRPTYFTLNREPYTVSVKRTPEEIQAMRDSCRLAKKFLNYAGSLVKPGVTTDEIDRKVHEAIVAEGAHPTPIGYPGDVKPFPKSICTSVNEVLGHGIPDSRPLEAGDVVSIDVSLYYNGFHGDTCGTFYVGTPEELEADPLTKRLIEVGRKATAIGVKTCKPGAPISSIGQAIQSYVEVEASSTPAGPELPQIQYLVSPYLTGHGIGRELHLPPSIIHVKNDIHEPMVPGLTFTIEPIIIERSTTPPVMDTKRLAGNMIRWRDGWTLVAADGKSRASQFEDTVLITEDGYEILTYDPESEGPRQVVFSTK